MDNFKAVYNILSALERSMDVPQFDVEQISAQALGISEERWKRYLEMMQDVGYIKGIEVKQYIGGATCVSADNIRITLRGLEYLQENTIMQRMYKAAKGIVDLIP